jgi:RecG-like helicase
LGTAQSGLVDARFAEFLSDPQLVRDARALADAVLAADPQLAAAPALRALASAGGEPDVARGT